MAEGECILIADDEKDIRELLMIFLKKDGYTVLEAANGAEAITLAAEHAEISLFLLDIMMPKKSGIEAAAEIRAISDAPILFLTAKSADRDKIRAYEAGGDDYIVKPFYPTDLRLKIQALIRRYRRAHRDAEESATEDILLQPDIRISQALGLVYRGEVEVSLTGKELDLLLFLSRHRGVALSPSDIYEAVWKEPYLPTSSNTVMVHIANLRKKLESDPQNPLLIRTVWGKGYRIDI